MIKRYNIPSPGISTRTFKRPESLRAMSGDLPPTSDCIHSRSLCIPPFSGVFLNLHFPSNPNPQDGLQTWQKTTWFTGSVILPTLIMLSEKWCKMRTAQRLWLVCSVVIEVASFHNSRMIVNYYHTIIARKHVSPWTYKRAAICKQLPQVAQKKIPAL